MKTIGWISLSILSVSSAFGGLAEVHAQQYDMFGETIDIIKPAIAPVTCTHPTSQRTAEVGATNGTAFFIDTHGVFLTASHVISGFLQGGKYDDCVPSVYVPIDGWSVKELKLQALRFVPSDCRLDETTDLA